MLNELICQKKLNLLDEQVVELSQSLDDLIVECVLCNKRLDKIKQMNINNIFGIHSTFYYYGIMHLFINMCRYIKDGVNKNELIYVSMEHELCDKLLEALETIGVSKDKIRFFSVKNLILPHKNGGLVELRNSICIYDAYDYTHFRKYIDEDTIKESLDTHSHILNKFVLKYI